MRRRSIFILNRENTEKLPVEASWGLLRPQAFWKRHQFELPTGGFWVARFNLSLRYVRRMPLMAAR